MHKKLVAITSILRAIELNELVQEGETRFICIYGETGTGKTSLGRYLRSQAPTPGLSYIAKKNFSQSGFVKDLLSLLELKCRGYQDGYNKLLKDYPVERPLVVDEAEYLGDENLEILRKLHDEIGITVVLLGKKDLYSQLKASKHEQLFDRAVHLVLKPLALRDCKDLANYLLDGITLAPDLIEEIRLSTGGNTRRFTTALRCIEKTCKLNNWTTCDLALWGDCSFLHDYTALPNFNYAIPKSTRKQAA